MIFMTILREMSIQSQVSLGYGQFFLGPRPLRPISTHANCVVLGTRSQVPTALDVGNGLEWFPTQPWVSFFRCWEKHSAQNR